MEHQKTHKRTDWRDGYDWKTHEVINNWLARLFRNSDIFIEESSVIDVVQQIQAQHPPQQSIEDEEIAEYKEKLEKLCHVSGSGHCPGCGLSPIALESILATRTTVCDQRVREERERCADKAWEYMVEATRKESWSKEELLATLTKTD